MIQPALAKSETSVKHFHAVFNGKYWSIKILLVYLIFCISYPELAFNR